MAILTMAIFTTAILTMAMLTTAGLRELRLPILHRRDDPRQHPRHLRRQPLYQYDAAHTARATQHDLRMGLPP